jgi:hypothetical protein
MAPARSASPFSPEPTKTAKNEATVAGLATGFPVVFNRQKKAGEVSRLA